jgi:hypothetical protein
VNTIRKEFIIRESSYLGYSINHSKCLDKSQLDKLIGTYGQALSDWIVVRAVRLDFSYPTCLSGEEQAILDIPDILSSYKKLNDRLRKKVELKRNWKVEYSEDKLLHIHTVYYFNNNEVQGFNLQSNLFKTIKNWWADITNEQGIVNLVPSYIADSDNTFSTSGKRYYSTLLSKDSNNILSYDISSDAIQYHLQKNKQKFPCGWIRWISYLAKDEQNASDYYRKCFG